MLDVHAPADIQIEIPQSVLDDAGVKPGQKLIAMNWGSSIVLVPRLSIAEMRGILAGIPNDFVRDKSDRDIYWWLLPCLTGLCFDSNIWIDWLVGAKSAAVFDPIFESGRLLVPSIVMFEVTRLFLARASEENSQQVGLYLSSSQRCVVDDIVAVEAAQLAKRH